MKNNVLTDDEVKTLKKNALDVLSVIRRNILSKYPFIGNIALHMEMVPTRDVRVRTACTDGNTIFFDIAFLSSLSTEERMFVLAHEIWHAVMLHLVRRHNRIPELFNIATDKEVNYILQQDGFKAPADLYFPDDDEQGKCAEEIYEMMLKKQKKMAKAKIPSSSSQGSGKNSKGNKSNNGHPNKNGNDDEDGIPKNDGKKDGTLTGQFDQHIYEDDTLTGKNPSGASKDKINKGVGEDSNNGSLIDGSANGSGEAAYSKIVDKYGEVGFDKDFQPKISKDYSDKMREIIIAEAQRTERERGSLPSHIKSLVKDLTTAEIPWEEVLAQFVTKCYNSGNRSWIPPNRRHVYNDVYIQSRQANKIKVCVGIDTSGSTVGDRGKFLSELQSLIKSFGLFDLHLIECDAEVGSYKHYTQDDNLEDDIGNGEYAMTGGGGTAMTPIFNYVLDHQIECDCICILTDGYIDDIPTNPIPNMPVLWVITKDGTEDFCDWGQKIRLKNSDND